MSIMINATRFQKNDTLDRKIEILYRWYKMQARYMQGMMARGEEELGGELYAR